MPFMTIFLMIAVTSSTAQQDNGLPVQLPQMTIQGSSAGSCPPSEVLAQARNAVTASIQGPFRDNVIPTLNGRSCPCGGAGPWRRIAYLNMSDPNQQRPPNWRLITTPERASSRSTTNTGSCDSESATFPSNGRSYSRVCGRINALQRGSPDAFMSTILHNPGLEGVYIDGISLMHGPAGSRQHIWSFAGALYETDPNYAAHDRDVCPCTDTNYNWPYQVPSFVGNDYFCDTGNPGPGYSNSRRVYTDDPLWDGEGCGPTSTCCQFNTPPWFCTTLPQPTADNIELRICGLERRNTEDIVTCCTCRNLYHLAS